MGSSERQPKQPLPGVSAKAEMPQLNLAPFILSCLFSLVPAEIPQASQGQRTGFWNTSQACTPNLRARASGCLWNCTEKESDGA